MWVPIQPGPSAQRGGLGVFSVKHSSKVIDLSFFMSFLYCSQLCAKVNAFPEGKHVMLLECSIVTGAFHSAQTTT